MTSFNVSSFWPLFTTAELRRFDYTAIDGSMAPITSVFSYDAGSKSMLLSDYSGGVSPVFKDKWYYQYRPGFGIAEWRDDYPGGKKVVMDAPIGWGDTQAVGSSYINYPQMVWYQSWPIAFSKGCQIVAFENLLPTYTNTVGTYKNVLQFTYLQSWDSKPATGARYWMAEFTGPISLQWIAQDPKNPIHNPLIVTSRMDAVISTVG